MATEFGTFGQVLSKPVAPPLTPSPARTSQTGHRESNPPLPIAILGVPIDNVTTQETVDLIRQMVASRKPHYLVTANVDFLVQALQDVELRRILFEAHLVLCDGTPLVWTSRLLGNPLPERVAGSDLVPLLMHVAAREQFRVFFLGGSTDTTECAISKLKAQLPSLQVAGHYSPPFNPLLEMDHAEMKRRIQLAKPDLLFVAFGCPKQEKWMAMHYASLGVPVSIGVGGTIDFLAGRLARAPKWMQQTGLEWTFRLAQEPRRLLKRYARDIWCFGWGLLRQWWTLHGPNLRLRETAAADRPIPASTASSWRILTAPEHFDHHIARKLAPAWQANEHSSDLLDLSQVQSIDSTGVALLIRLQKLARMTGRTLVLLAPSAPVRRAIALMHLDSFFDTAPDFRSAESFQLAQPPAAKLHPSILPRQQALHWQGEVTAANADDVWQITEQYIRCHSAWHKELSIDLVQLRFIDSTGAGLMVRAKKAAQQSGATLAFTHPHANVRNVLRLARLEAFLLSSPHNGS